MTKIVNEYLDSQTGIQWSPLGQSKNDQIR